MGYAAASLGLLYSLCYLYYQQPVLVGIRSLGVAIKKCMHRPSWTSQVQRTALSFNCRQHARPCSLIVCAFIHVLWQFGYQSHALVLQQRTGNKGGYPAAAAYSQKLLSMKAAIACVLQGATNSWLTMQNAAGATWTAELMFFGCPPFDLRLTDILGQTMVLR